MVDFYFPRRLLSPFFVPLLLFFLLFYFAFYAERDVVILHDEGRRRFSKSFSLKNVVVFCVVDASCAVP